LQDHAGNEVESNHTEDSFSGRSGLIPEPGFHAPESGCQGVTDSKASDGGRWKINKNKEILNGGSLIRNGYQAA
jgi:hypothetical protein